MIDRYEASEITRIWSEKNKYRKWLDVELAITETWAEMGEVPAASLKNIRENAAVDPERIRVIEKKVKHDVIAFLTSLEEAIGRDSAYVHKGITSYDVVDTALSLLIGESLDVVLAKCGELGKILLVHEGEAGRVAKKNLDGPPLELGFLEHLVTAEGQVRLALGLGVAEPELVEGDGAPGAGLLDGDRFDDTGRPVDFYGVGFFEIGCANHAR